jgi:hypothetical protein
LKLYPTAIAVRVSSEETVNVIDAPCAVVPLHWPTLSDEEDGDVGPLLHAEASTPASVPTHHIDFVRVQIATRPWAIPFPFSQVAFCVCVRPANYSWSRPPAALAAIRGSPRANSNRMSLCARMLARIPEWRRGTWLAARPALDARGRGETTVWSHHRAAVQATEDQRFRSFERTGARVHSPPALAATPKADAFRGDRRGCARPAVRD